MFVYASDFHQNRTPLICQGEIFSQAQTSRAVRHKEGQNVLFFVLQMFFVGTVELHLDCLSWFPKFVGSFTMNFVVFVGVCCRGNLLLVPCSRFKTFFSYICVNKAIRPATPKHRNREDCKHARRQWTHPSNTNSNTNIIIFIVNRWPWRLSDVLGSWGIWAQHLGWMGASAPQLRGWVVGWPIAAFHVSVDLYGCWYSLENWNMCF